MKGSEIKNQDFRLFLQNELLERCKRNRGYSLRAFAKSLQTDYSTLSKVLKGKRVLGDRAIKKIGLRIGLGPKDLTAFLEAQPQSVYLSRYNEIAEDTFRIISDWEHFAILEIMRVDDFDPSPRWIAKAFGITVSEANAAIERLVRTGMLEILSDGTWRDLTGEKTTNIPSDKSSEAMRKLQKQILEKAVVALEEVPITLRNQSAMTMAIDAEKLPQAKEKIAAFRKNLARFLSRGKKRTQVYNLSVSLYPLTNIERR